METNKQIPIVHEKSITDSVLQKIKQFQTLGSLTLPPNYSPENALKSAFLILQETKDKNGKRVLESCSKESTANALLNMIVQGLNPMKKQCYFVAYGTQLSLMRSYQGTIALAKRLAGVKSVVSQAVFEGDEFSFGVNSETGVKSIIKHVQKLENLNPEKVTGAYAVIEFEDGRRRTEIMNINQIKKAWQQGSAGGNSKAHTNFTDEMAKKTVINRACKMLIGGSDDGDLYDEMEQKNTIAEAVKSEISEHANTEELNVEDISFEDVNNTSDNNNLKPVTEPTPAPY